MQNYYLGEKYVKPAFFQLSTNYRSPGGIVDCARSVIDLLTLFPRAIDVLDRERGVIPGLRPLFLFRENGAAARTFFQLGAE